MDLKKEIEEQMCNSIYNAIDMFYPNPTSGSSDDTNTYLSDKVGFSFDNFELIDSFSHISIDELAKDSFSLGKVMIKLYVNNFIDCLYENYTYMNEDYFTARDAALFEILRVKCPLDILIYLWNKIPKEEIEDDMDDETRYGGSCP